MTMKKLYSTILVLATMVAALSLTACGGDNDDENSSESKLTNENIIGDWQSVTCQGYTIVLEDGERKDDQEHPYEYMHIKIYKDGTCIFGNPTNFKGTWKINGKELYIELEDGLAKKSIKYIIEELTKDKLVISIVYYGLNGWNKETEYHSTFTLIRVNKYL